jgi:hypothetical protein
MNTNHIRGKLLVKESGIGIPNLIVVAYDLDPCTKAEELFELCSSGRHRELWAAIQGDRLGSIISDEGGTFELEFDDSAFQVRNREVRPDLLLLVTSPEESNVEVCPLVLHVSCGVRQNAGRLEHYLIQIPTEQLKKAGLRVPASHVLEPERPEDIRKRLKAEDEREQQIRDGVRELSRTRLQRLRKQREEVEKVLSSPVSVLSAVPEAVRKTPNYLEPGDSIEKTTLDVITDAIETQLNDEQNPARQRGMIVLTQEQRESLNIPENLVRENIKASELQDALFKRNGVSSLTDLIRVDPFTYCRPETHPDEGCGTTDLSTAGTGSESSEQPEEEAANEYGQDASLETMPGHIANLINAVVSPERTLLSDGGRRADQGEVQAQLEHFELRPGPADTPAFYDFHSLEIAFDHVWREAFDKETFDSLKELYVTLADLGTDPGALFGSSSDPADVVEAARGIYRATLQEIPQVVIMAIDLTPEQWTALTRDEQSSLEALAARYLNMRSQSGFQVRTDVMNLASFLGITRSQVANMLTRAAQEVVSRFAQYARSKSTAGSDGYAHFHRLLQRLFERLAEPYAFTIYAASREERSVNFGLVTTYRQKWEPLNYQPGELVKTIPLAPKETRRFTKKVVRKTRRSEKEVENNLSSRRNESGVTSRVEEEVIRKANTKTNFQLTADVGFNLLIFKNKLNVNFGREGTQSSDEIKKQFREEVVKSAEEYKRERTLEINTEASEDFEAEETGEISNPNDELPVTFLFYELQRRYRISERIHRVRPVILVAQEVPHPHEIDEHWLVAHDWILRRVILDDSFLPALTYLSTGLVGHEFALEELRKSMELQRGVMEEIKEEVAVIHRQAGARYAALERSVERGAEVALGDDIITYGTGPGFRFRRVEENEESARIREEAAKDAHERAAREEKEMRARLEREVTALAAATEAYTKALREHLDRKTQVARLRVHVKENILYYMQAIWNHEPPDQRFFRLHRTTVPRLTGQLRYNINPAASATNASSHANATPVQIEARCALDLPLETTTLSEVADLDNLLGYKGNYMIFPLKEGNCLTDFMMTPYLDTELGLRDPDEFGNWTPEEFAEYVCCLKKNLNNDAFHAIRNQLREHYRKLLSAPRRLSEEIVVPTGSLFIEALPGVHPILEDFKLRHRAMDVKKVQAEVRKAELENLRLASRLLAGEYEDPDIEKKIVVEGGSGAVMIPADEDT